MKKSILILLSIIFLGTYKCSETLEVPDPKVDPFSFECEDLIDISGDVSESKYQRIVLGDSIKTGLSIRCTLVKSNNIVIEKTESGIWKRRVFPSSYVSISIKVVGARSYIESLFFIFRDGSSLILNNRSSDRNTTLSFSFGGDFENYQELEELKTKEIEWITAFEEKESMRIKFSDEQSKIFINNLNYLSRDIGIWTIRNYVDSFGELTEDSYITTSKVIKGLFSNSATQNSDLDVCFLITNSTNIDIELFEYAGNNPVKAYSPDKYKVLIQDELGKRLQLEATNYSDRLSFGKNASLLVHNTLMKAKGTIKFIIIEHETPINVYKFNVAPWGYKNAYRELMGG